METSKDTFKQFCSAVYNEKPFSARKAFSKAVGEKILGKIQDVKNTIAKTAIKNEK